MRARSLILVDDHALMRAGIRSLLDELPGVEVVAEAGDGVTAITMVRHLQPDAIMLDITLPGLNGLEVAAQVRKQYPRIRILVVSMHTGPEYAARALTAGADGYLFKDAAFEELALALEAVFAGEKYLSSALDTALVEKLTQLIDEGRSELDMLTPRQRQILQLIAEGLGTRDIADRLHVSIKTVETHRAQLMERLAIHDVPGLVRFAIRMGLVTPEG